jgi:hypothetical protein
MVPDPAGAVGSGDGDNIEALVKERPSTIVA